MTTPSTGTEAQPYSDLRRGNGDEDRPRQKLKAKDNRDADQRNGREERIREGETQVRKSAVHEKKIGHIEDRGNSTKIVSDMRKAHKNEQHTRSKNRIFY
jgi:hypothetical protein